MSVESATYISQLDDSNPTGLDQVSEGDNHIQLIKAVLQNNFPNLTAAAVTPTTTELNLLVGAGTTGATGFNVVTQAPGNNTTLACSTAFASALAFSATLPTGWANYGPDWDIKTADYTAVNSDALMCNTTAGAFTVTLPATPAANDVVRIADYAGTFATYALTVGRNGSNIMGLAEDMTISTNNVGVTLTYIDSTQGWRLT